MFKIYEIVVFYTLSNQLLSKLLHIDNLITGLLYKYSQNVPSLVLQTLFGDSNRHGIIFSDRSINLRSNDVSSLYYKKFKVNLKDLLIPQRNAVQQIDLNFDKYIFEVSSTLEKIFKLFCTYNYSIIPVSYDSNNHIVPNDIISCEYNIQNQNNKDAIIDLRSIDINFLLNNLRSRDLNFILGDILGNINIIK